MVGEWHVDLQGLPEAGRRWDILVPARLLEDRSLGVIEALRDLEDDIHWQFSLEPVGDVYRLHGFWQGHIRRQCSRCNAFFDWAVSGETERDYQLGARPLDDHSDCDYLSPPGEIFLPDVLREDVWLAWQADVVCSDACKGLCPQCGCNLNEQSCSCGQTNGDHPFAALAALKLDA